MGPEQNTLAGPPRLILRPWRELSAIALMVMDLSWIIAWHSAIMPSAERPSKASLFLLYGSIVLLSYLGSSLMHWIQLKPNIRRAALLSLLMLSYAFMLRSLLYVEQQLSIKVILENARASFGDTSTFLPPELLVLILCSYLVFWSAMLPSSWIGVSVVRKRLQLGIALLFLLGWTGVFLQEIRIAGEILLFLTASLIGLAAAKTSTLSALRGGARPEFSVRFMLGISLNAILIAAIGFLLGHLASIGLSGPTAALFFVAVRLLAIILLLLLSPVILLIGLLISWLGGTLSDIPILRAIELEIQNVLRLIASFIEAVATFIQDLQITLPDLAWLRPFVLWAIVGLVLFIAFREFGRRELSWGKVRELAIKEGRSFTIGSLRDWLQKYLMQQASQALNRWSNRDRTGYLAAVRIRRIYAQLTRLCERLEVPRASTATPLEYLEDLERLFPEEKRQVRVITQAYNRVRYGELPERPEEVRSVERAWREVRQRARDLQAVRKQFSAEELL